MQMLTFVSSLGIKYFKDMFSALRRHYNAFVMPGLVSDSVCS